MASSLLAHLYSHIKGSQEDVATLSLQYIVSSSPALNREFTRILEKALQGSTGKELRYVCQSVGENKERPDIAGIDSNGKEQILCEAKFYAGLTENQPNGYLNRLIKAGGFGLVFICPSARKVTLWSKILELCQDRAVESVDEFCVIVDGIHMSVLTWGAIIDSLRQVASSEAPVTLQDIHQLDGFCKLMDDEAFIPFSTEDFGPINAIREERHYQVVDAIFDRLIADKSLHANAKSLRATPYRNGYVRYIRVLDFSLAIHYDRRLWRSSRSEETPFWVMITDREFKQPVEFRKAFNRYQESWKESINDGIALALFAPANAALDEVAEELVRQILKYILELEDALKYNYMG